MNSVTICLATYGGCVVGSLVPLVNTELLVISMSALAPAALLVPIVALAAVGQLTGQALLYFAGRGSLRWKSLQSHPRVAALLAQMQARQRAGGLLLFTSATAGLPPVTAMSLVSGMMRLDLPRFLAVILVGRLIRYGVLVSLPHLFTQVAR